jgi:hypothetical protein
MDLQEDHDEDTDGDEGMQLPLLGLVEPVHQLAHQPRGIEGTRGLEDDANLVAVGIEDGNAVGGRLVLAAMALVLVVETQRVAVELLAPVRARSQ